MHRERLWVDGDKPVRPVPWDTEHLEPLRFDANTATTVDFLSMSGLALSQCRALEALRERRGGFATMAEFRQAVNGIFSPEA